MFLKKHRQFFARHPLATYGLLYVYVALAFATAYWMMPGQFYHSTAMYEPMLTSDRELIRSGLQDVLRGQGQKNLGAAVLTHFGTDYPIGAFTVYDVEYESGQFIVGTTIHGEHTCAAIPKIIIPARIEEDWLNDKTSSQHAVISAAFRPFEMENEAVSARHAAPPPPVESPFDPFIAVPREGERALQGMLKIPRSLFDLMNGYADAKEGFAGNAMGSFWRMVYLSTVTITTLGYGDIVPITPLARTLVGAEAVVGMLVIGLYLNALSQRVGRTA